jgi:hypothetical protein
MSITINIDGPRDPRYVLELAEGFAEIARALNHVTRDHAALRYPSEADQLLRDISLALSRVPQLLGQVAGWLDAEYEEGRITMAGGEFPQRALAVMAVRARLEEAGGYAMTAGVAVDQAAEVTSHMAVREGGDEERGAG